MFKTTEKLYAELAQALGLETLPADAQGSLQLQVGGDSGEGSTVVVFAESETSLMLASPVMDLPLALDYGRALWLLRRNFHDSPVMPFRIACDAEGSIVIWGRVPIAGMSGSDLAGLIDSLAAEAERIREEVEVDESEG